MVISDTDDSDKVLKVLRAVSIQIHLKFLEGFPQIPSEAYALAESKIKELTEQQQASIKKELGKITKKIRR